MKAQINLKVDKQAKSQAQKLAKELGLSLSSIVNASLKQFVRARGVSFSTAPTMTPYLENIVAQAEQDLASGNVHGPFKTPEALVKSLKK